MGQQFFPKSFNILKVRILAVVVSPVQGFVCEQFFPQQSPFISTTFLPGSQVPQQAVTCHLNKAQAQPSGTTTARYPSIKVLSKSRYLSRQVPFQQETQQTIATLTSTLHPHDSAMVSFSDNDSVLGPRIIFQFG